MDNDALRWVHDLADGKLMPTDGEMLHRALTAIAKVAVLRQEQLDHMVGKLWELELRIRKLEAK